MKLEQREGRSIRLGSSHRNVEVLRFAPHPELDRFIRLQAALTRKEKLPGAAGLGAGGQACLAVANRSCARVWAHKCSAQVWRGLLRPIAVFWLVSVCTRDQIRPRASLR